MYYMWTDKMRQYFHFIYLTRKEGSQNYTLKEF